MATAMLVQSRRQRASLEAEYAEAEALLLEAKENMETSQRGQMQLALELRARAEAAEAEVARLREEMEGLQRGRAESDAFASLVLVARDSLRAKLTGAPSHPPPSKRGVRAWSARRE
jgi:hypothetical protein